MGSADRIATRVMATGLVAAALVLGARPAAAAPSNVVLRQLTNITTGTIESVKLRSQDGADIAFVSTGDVMGPGTATAMRQVYVWREFEDGSSGITQVTHGLTCESYDVARPTDTVLSDRPEVIAFASTCDLDPTVGNADGNAEIFFYELDTGVFHQITNTGPGVTNREPFTSDSGRCLVFRSNGNIDNNTPSNPYYDDTHPGPHYSNSDGSDEVFLYSKLENDPQYPHNAVFTQVSDGPPGSTSSHPVINGYYFPRQCQTVAYQSDHDQLNEGHTGQLIFIYKMGMSALLPITAAEIPMGFPSGIYRNPMISGASPFARGPHIVFESEPDLWRNNSKGTNIFDWRDFHPRMTQYTNIGAGFVVSEPQVGDGGGVIAVSSTGELLNQAHTLRTGEVPPFNADGNSEIFRMEGRKTVTQITQTSGCQNLHPALKDDGNRLAFISTCDIIAGQNSTNQAQVFLWGLEQSESPLLVTGTCLQANGCCYITHDTTTCYHQLKGRKPKIERPGCLDKPGGCDG